MEIKNIVSESGIRPADIERMTNGDVKLPQASVMIKKALAGGNGMNSTTKWFLNLAAQIHSRGLYPEKQSCAPLVVDTVDLSSIAKEAEKVKKVLDVTKQEVERAVSVPIKEAPAEYRPDQSGLNTMDDPMTKKFKGHIKGYGEAWVLYAKKCKYILPVS